MRLSLFDLTGRKAMVTGGSRGLGRSCAVGLAAAGADVAIVGRKESSGESTAEVIRRMGRDSFFVRCDVTEADEVKGAIDAIVRRFGRLDIAINNAGTYCAGADEVQSKDEWDRVMGVNLTGTWLCAQAQMRQMIRQQPIGGKIVNVASIAGSTVCSNGSYDASKAAVIQLTKTLAARWGRYNINVNCVSPGYVIAVMGSLRSPEERRRLRELTPMGYVQRLEDVCGSVIFLASSASDYVTGHNLIVDGGHTLSSWVVPPTREVPPRVDPEEELAET